MSSSALGQRGLHRLDDRVFLQDFAGHVQRQVVGVDHTFDEAQVQRQERFGLFHDEHALHVQLQAARRFALVQVERCTGRDVQQRVVFELAFDLVVAPSQRVFEVMADVLVELLVFLVLDLGTRTGPQGAGTVDGFPLFGWLLFAFGGSLLLRQLNRQGDVVGVLLDHIAQAPAIGELFLFLLQVQDDAGTALWLVDGGDFKFALAFRRPVHAFGSRLTGATAVHIDLVGHDERGVEAHTELTDQMRVLLLVTGEVLHEVGGAGLGDSAKVSDDIFAAHADAVVLKGNGTGILVEAQANFQLIATFKQLWLGQGFETQFVHGVGGVGNQFPQEDFLVRVQRMNHEVQQLLHLGLEAQRFLLCFHSHGLRNSDLIAVAPGGRLGLR